MTTDKAGSNSARLVELPTFLKGLVAQGRISESQCKSALNQVRPGLARKHVLEQVADLQLPDSAHPGQTLDLDELTRCLAEQSGQDFYRLDPLQLDAARITEVMSYAFTQHHQILAVEVNAHDVVIASAEPWNKVWEQNLSHVLRKPIRRVIANPVELKRVTAELYRLSESISLANASGKGQSRVLANLEQMLELGGSKDPEANDQHIVNIVDWLLQYAFEQRASDIHIEPRRDIGNVRFRIDGVLYTVYRIPIQVLNAVTSRLKILGRMNVAEKRRPQDGRLKTKSPEGEEVELRLSTMPTAFGEKLVMRIFDPDVLLKSFNQLGLGNEDLMRWNHMTSQKHGIVLITGPTGSGKTTTLYSTLKSLATPEVNVCTIEDPIEMVEPSFNQMQVQENIDLNFADGVRSLLRQDPDIIMIGEIRDLETAEMAVQAALTGHLVFSTLHTNDAPSAIARLMELGVPTYLIKATLIGVMAQRLIRMLCPHCKQETEVDEAAWRSLTQPWKTQEPAKIFEPVGCLKCRETGYQGRQGIYEVMPFSESLYPYAEDKSDLPKLRRQAYKDGMLSLRLSGAMKVSEGATTIAEVMRVAPEIS